MPLNISSKSVIWLSVKRDSGARLLPPVYTYIQVRIRGQRPLNGRVVTLGYSTRQQQQLRHVLHGQHPNEFISQYSEDICPCCLQSESSVLTSGSLEPSIMAFT
ncbi:hypothetical protein TKK_0016173 [Trichogramma kaykai]